METGIRYLTANAHFRYLILSFLALLCLAGLAGAVPNVTVPQGFSVAVITTGVNSVGSTPPYSYQWFEECAGCISYASVAGATNSIYFFDTNTLTAPGNYSFILQISDSASHIANSPTANVFVGGPNLPILLPSGLPPNTGFPIDYLLAAVSMIFFVMAITRRAGSAQQIGLYIASFAFMWMGIVYTLLPAYPVILSSNQIMLASSPPITISAYNTVLVSGTSPNGNAIYIKGMFGVIYTIICLVFAVGGVLARFSGNTELMNDWEGD
jgi:hypothetical protein